jgi:STE24 endopeptidase
MPLVKFIPILSVALIALRWAGSALLEHLNRRQVEAHRESVPEPFRATMDAATYAKSVDYTLAKSRFGQWSDLWDHVVLLVLLFSGWLPLSWSWVQAQVGTSAWAAAGWMFGIGVALSIPALPWEWWAQFRLEERFGFNTTTAGTWVADRVKGFVLASVLGYPLLGLLLKLVDWMGPTWWLWGWAVMTGFQVLMLFLAPVVILPLFNQFTPLPDGPLRQRLLALGERTGFSARTIQVMDGSKRSRHSNAFFTGFGRFRKIVLFDTLVNQLTPEELEAVLAHEIGHHRRRHIPQRLAWATVVSLGGFGLIGWLTGQETFLGAFGFPPGAGVAPAMLLLALLGGTVTFWFTPLGNVWSRRHEFEADRYAREAVGSAEPLIGALRKLSEKNLSNLTPHPWYSGFHYSHPTLLEREKALRQ